MLYRKKITTGRFFRPHARVLSISLLFLLVGAPLSSSYAQTDMQESNNSASFLRGASVVKDIELAEGASVTITLSRDAKEVFVSDPTLIDAVARNARTVFIVGKTGGRGTVVVSDKDNQEIMTINLNIGRDLNTLRAALKTAIPTGEIDFTVNNASIILTGFVDNAADAATAQDIAKTFFSGVQWQKGNYQRAEVINSLKIRGKEQVMIKVTIAEVQRNVMKTLNVNSTFSNNVLRRPGNALIETGAQKAYSALGSFSGDGGVFNLLSPHVNIDIQALESTGVARLLAEPTLVAISGETAKFRAGGQIPVAVDAWNVTDGANQRVTYQYRDVGVGLEFTPMVLTEGRISMKVKTEVIEVDAASKTSNGSVAFTNRSQETTIELPSGASMVTAGLIQQTSHAVIQGNPGLMNIPVLGTLFRSRNFQKKETELMIIVTPYIAKAMQPTKIAKPTDGLVFASDPQAMLLGHINRIYGVPNQKNSIRSTNNRFKGGFITD